MTAGATTRSDERLSQSRDNRSPRDLGPGIIKAIWITIAGVALTLGIITARWAHHGPIADSEGVTVTTTRESVPRHLQGASPAPAGGSDGAVPLPPLRFGERVPDLGLVDQDGKEFQLSDLRGNAVALAFIYTHCNMPSMCPQATGKFVELMRRATTAGIANLRLVLVSFDTERDQPQRLKEFATLYGTEAAGVTLATGDANDIAGFARRLNTFYRERTPGVFEHNIVVSLIDHEGVLRDDLFGAAWEIDEVLSALQTLENRRQDVKSEMTP